MSGEGKPDLAGLDLAEADCSALRVGVVAATWHATVMDGLLGGALRALSEAQVEAPTVIRVPGSFELPVMVAEVAKHGYDAVVALGVIIRGGTPHFEYVCRAATDGLSRVALDSGVPVGFGVLTCDDEQQALDRTGGEGAREDKGHEVAQAAMVTALEIRRLRHPY
ncbi:MAG TPA: 6,7-dimethyl-8-ribityllumazine synthase [Nocardioidaceae bacterium]|nr:6,7-dimethyl-8-ribityllumazine synthase [Nocardioidaceae bacterium]